MNEIPCSVKFITLWEFMDKLQQAKGRQKTALLKQFYEKSTVSNFYPIIRLMLPDMDTARGPYNLAEKMLAKIYSEILLLPEQEAKALQHHRNPSKQPPGWTAGAFHIVLSKVLRNRSGRSAELSVAQINNILDQLVSSTNRKQKKEILKNLLHQTDIKEQIWISKIILKEMQLGSGETILKSYHSRAVDLYYSTSSLCEVFTALQSNVEYVGPSYQLHSPIKPMLSSRKTREQISSLLENKQVLVEVKYDGERSMWHWSNDGRISFFTRNLKDFTHRYGRHLQQIFQENLTIAEVILDGEMIVWDTNNDKAMQWGLNAKISQLPEGTQSDLHMSYQVFDILYIKHMNGTEEDLTELPLIKRKKILRDVIPTVDRRLEVVNYNVLSGASAVMKYFHDALLNQEEGIVIKDTQSPYIPNDRSNHWIKMKAAYMDGLGDTMDVLIIAGYYGKGHYSERTRPEQHISDFLVGVVDSINPQNPKLSKIIPFGVVSAGFRHKEKRELKYRLRNNWAEYSQQWPPAYWPPWKPGSNERPDVYITDPSKSFLVEIHGGEIHRTSLFPTRLLLRFPVVKRIRYDKVWDECMTMQELKDLKQNYKQNMKNKISAVEVLDSDNETSAPDSPEEVVEVKIETWEKDKIFFRLRFFVATGASRASTEGMIQDHGGTIVREVAQGVDYFIAPRVTNRLLQIAATHDHNIISSNWIHEWVSREQIIAIKPKHLLETNLETSLYLSTYWTDYEDLLDEPYQEAQDYQMIQVSQGKINVTIESWKNSWLFEIPSQWREALLASPAYRYIAWNVYIYDTTDYDEVFKGKKVLTEIYKVKLQALGANISENLDTSVSHLFTINGDLPKLDFALPILTISDINLI